MRSTTGLGLWTNAAYQPRKEGNKGPRSLFKGEKLDKDQFMEEKRTEWADEQRSLAEDAVSNCPL